MVLPKIGIVSECGVTCPGGDIVIHMYVILQSGILLTPPISTRNRGATRVHLIPPTHLIHSRVDLFGKFIARNGG